jgi:CheY-like chemotaxis protein
MEEALEKNYSEKPDIIITDINMPLVSGLDIINNVRMELNLDIPIIILSALGLEETVQKAFDLGADDLSQNHLAQIVDHRIDLSVLLLNKHNQFGYAFFLNNFLSSLNGWLEFSCWIFSGIFL